MQPLSLSLKSSLIGNWHEACIKNTTSDLIGSLLKVVNTIHDIASSESAMHLLKLNKPSIKEAGNARGFQQPVLRHSYW